MKSSKTPKSSTVGALALATAASASQAALVTVNETVGVISQLGPDGFGLTDVANWDIDGNGSPEISLIAKSGGSGGQSFASLGGPGGIYAQNGFQAVDKNGNAGFGDLTGVFSGDVIGSGANFKSDSYFINIIDGGVVSPNKDLAPGDNFIGFQFNPTGSQVLYGYAVLNLVEATDPGGNSGDFAMSVTGWVYDDSGAAVTVAPIAAVPELSSTGLVALALGAAGLTRWRKQNKA